MKQLLAWYKRNKVAAIVILLLFGYIFGSSIWFEINQCIAQPIIAGKVLSEKYGERIIAKNAKAKFSGFSVVCYPVRDKDVSFQAVILDDGAYLRDEYVQGVISKELRTQIEPIIKELTSDFWVDPIVYYAETNYESINDVTLENYLEQIEHPKCNINIFVNKKRLKDLSLEEEYRLYEEKISNIDHFFGTVYVFYVNHSIVETKKAHFYDRVRDEDSYDKTSEMIPDIRLVYRDQKLVTSFENFCKRRLAVAN